MDDEHSIFLDGLAALAYAQVHRAPAAVDPCPNTSAAGCAGGSLFIYKDKVDGHTDSSSRRSSTLVVAGFLRN